MRLRETELFALAAAWGDKLRGRASLQVPTHAGRLHPRDEQWLTLELQKLARRSVRLETRDATRDFVAQVRETLDVWHAIACCPGFTGSENPVFWRRVVSHTYRRTHLRQHGCSDEFTFFQTAASSFPRIRLYFEDRLAYETTDDRARDEARHVDAVCRAFFGLEKTDYPASPPSAEFVEAMARLKPFVSRARFEKVIPIAMDLPSWDTVHLYPMMMELLKDLRAAPSGSRASRFHVEELSLDDMRVLLHHDTTNAFEAYQHWLKLPGIRITHWWWKSQSMDMDAMVPPSAVRVATGLDESAVGRLQTLLVNRHTLTDQQFGGLCAALPKARSLRHVRFSELSRRHDWAWLAMALFHRDAATSSWRELSVDMCHLDRDDLDAIRSVRHLGLASLPGIVGELQVYQGNTVVRVQEDTMIHVDGSAVPVVHHHAAWLDVVGQRDSNRVGVIVPAYGLGYVDSSTVVERESITRATIEAPTARLTHFRAMVMTSSPAELRDWICLIGSATLELVEVIDHVPLAAHAVQSVLQACPRLTSLMVIQDGAVWTHEMAISHVTPTWPQLQTLNICLSSTQQAIALLEVLGLGRAGPLPGLRQLRLEITPLEDDDTTIDESSLRGVALAAADLLRRVRTLTHLNVHGVTPARGRGEIQTLTYDEYRDTVMSTLDMEEATLDTTSDGRVALLSVLYHPHEKVDGDSLLPMLTPDLLRIVFAYAGRTVRQAWIEL